MSNLVVTYEQLTSAIKLIQIAILLKGTSTSSTSTSMSTSTWLTSTSTSTWGLSTSTENFYELYSSKSTKYYISAINRKDASLLNIMSAAK